MSNLKNFCQSVSKRALQSIGVGVATTAMALGAGVFAESASAVTIGGVQIDKFASDVFTEGDFNAPNGDILTALTDGVVETYAVAVGGQGFATFGFNDQVFNDVGADIALFDLDESLAEFKVIINGITKIYQSSFTGSFTDDSDSFPVNVATVELSDFGLSNGDFINTLTIDFNTASSPSLALVGSLQRSVPEPSVMFGLLATVGFLASQRGLKFAKKAQ